MTIIKIYPSNLPSEPLESHYVDYGTLHDWLVANCPSYQAGGVQPIVVLVNNAIIPPNDWHTLHLDDDIEIDIKPLARGLDPFTIAIIALVAAVTLPILLQPNAQTISSSSSFAQGQSIEQATLQANTPQKNGIIPEIAGRHKFYPDYLCQPRRYFLDTRTEVIDAMLCIGQGEFEIDSNEIYIADTPLNTFGDDVSYTIYAPGANVSASAAHRNWYNIPEVGFTRSSVGLRLIDEDPTDPTGDPSTVTGSITLPLNFLSVPATFAINGDSVTLDQNYVDTAAVLTAINGQLNTNLLLASVNLSGALVITEQYPFTGIGLTGTGSIAAVFGTPTYVTGEISTGLWIGPFRLSPTDEVIRQIEFEVFAPQGLGRLNDDGSISSRSRDVELQWRTNGGTWTSIINTVSGNTRDQMGWTFAEDLGATYDNVDVRMRRIGAESKDSKDLDRLEWYGMRCLLPSATSYAGVTTMAVTIKGTDRIAATSENKINLIVTRKLNGVATRSIDDWVSYVCTDIGYTTNDIDTAELARLGVIWDARGDYFDYVFNAQQTVRDAITKPLAAGFAELTIDEGRIRPVRDELRSVYEHLYTPQNMTSELVRQFSSYDPDDYDGVDVEYLDATTWTTETVECRLSGDVGVRIRKIQTAGVTNKDKAWRLGMRQRRIDAYRRKAYTFSTEWDALNSRYLSYCALSDDVPGYGQSALLMAINGQTLTVSEPLKWTNAVAHVVGLRRTDGTLCGPFAATRINDYTMTFTGLLDFAPITSASSIEQTHVIFGTTTRWSYPVLITEITPSGDTVDVKAVNYDARIYADDDNIAPS
jgi:hypothetical protein